jgi:Heterokaryon incompatibility protein (HET)
MSTSGTDYDYQSLDPQRNEIRLLKIKPTFRRKSPISCSLQVVSLDSASLPEYAALSYCWGAGPADQAIDCDGSIIRVTSGLLDALRTLRKLTRLCLWIDQICVNQADLEERSSQIPLMRRIYPGAAKTFLQLCPHSEFPRRIEILLRSCSLLIHARRRKRHVRMPRLCRLLMLYGMGSFRRLMRAIHDQRCYSRAWIIQEVSLSANVDVICRDFAIKWAHFAPIARQCCNDSLTLALESDTDGERADVGELSFTGFDDAVGAGKSEEDKTLWNILNFSNGIRASDPRDQIYALLGLAKDAEEFPQSDYELPVADVYRSFASAFITKGHGAEALSLSYYGPKNREYPSWVPDWEQSFSGLDLQGLSHFSAGSDNGIFHVEGADRILLTEGLIVDTVLWIFPPVNGVSPSNAPRIFEKVLDFVRGTVTAIQNDPEVLRGFLSGLNMMNLHLMLIQYLVFDHDGGGFTSGIGKVSSILEGAATKAMLTPAGPFQKAADEFVTGALSEHLNRAYREQGFNFLTMLLIILRQGTFAITATGRLCLTVVDVEPGDKIAVILGCRAPHMMREDGDGFLNIGETYIRGLMHGEALDDKRYNLQKILIH